MLIAAAPVDEEERLAALHRLGILDTAPEERFDRIVALASLMLDTPITVVSLLDRDRQWFKAKVGIDADETSRDAALCAHTILEPSGAMVVADTLDDVRFHDNPFVAGAPHVRFYAGRVLRDRDGLALGTLCAIDDRPRQFGERQRQALDLLAGMVEQELDRDRERVLMAEVATGERQQSLILDSLAEGIILRDSVGRILRWNRAAERLLGVTSEALDNHVPGSGGREILRADGSVMAVAEYPALAVVTTKSSVVGQVMGVPRPGGQLVWLRVDAHPVLDEDGMLVGVVSVLADVTEEHRARRLLDATLETAPVGLAILDGQRTIVRCNPTFARQAGRPADDLVGRDVAELIHPDDRDVAITIGHELRGGAIAAETVEQRVQRPDGAEMVVETHLALIPDPDQPLCIAATFDLTERRRMTMELSRFSYFFQHATDVIVVVDTDGHVLYVSPSSMRVLGYPPELRHPRGVLAIVHPDDRGPVVEEITAIVDHSREPRPFVVRVLTAWGEWRHMECTVADLLDEPAVRGLVITARDATEREREAQALAHRANHDPLTGLPNRSAVEAMIDEALIRPRPAPERLGVCFIDLDGFKAVNDTLGHAAGDQFLVEVGGRIRRSVRKGDVAGRIGGDEFVVLVNGVESVEEALEAAGRIRDSIVGDGTWRGMRVGASVGLGMSAPGDDSASLLRRADGALYTAKARRDSSVELAAEPAGR